MLVKKKKKRPAAPATEGRPPIHCALYGDPGSQKSTMAATFPHPMLVMFFDGLGKDTPYRKRAARLGLVEKGWEGEEGQRIAGFCDAEGVIKLQIEYYWDKAPELPWAANAYRERMLRFFREDEAQLWATFVLDSASALNDVCMNLQQGINPGSDEDKGLRWVAGATTDLERFLVRSLPYVPINLVTLYHIQHEKVVVKVGKAAQNTPTHPLQKGMAEWQDSYRRSLALPGRLSKSNAIFRQYAECYRLWVGDDGKVKCQTRASDEYVASSQIGAPDGCAPKYSALWGVD